jgi:RNA polymerase sigma factor (sigma-70 family)
MLNGQLRDVVRRLHQLAGEAGSGMSDASLLQRVVSQRDEAAFELLLRRHGPMVRGVCRRLLRHVHDADDAFQATFLALVRKAGGINRRGSLAGWLYRVAFRIALRAREAAARLPVTALEAHDPCAPAAACDLVWRDLRPVLDEEIHHLPARYSVPVILCYLQGLTHEQAARAIGCAKGTVAVRLLRARKLLHARFTRRGLTLSTAALATALTEHAAHATVPAACIQATITAALGFVTGSTTAASTGAVSLARGVMRAMFLNKLKATAAVIVLAAGMMGLGFGLLPRSGNATATAPATTAPPTPTAAAEPRATDFAVIVNIRAQREGRILFLGVEVKKGEAVPADDVVADNAANRDQRFRRLKVGDKVDAGQLIGLLDDRQARIDVGVCITKVKQADASRTANEKTRDEAIMRVKIIEEKNAKAPGSVAVEEYRAAQLNVHRYTGEEIEKRAWIRVREFELEQAKKLLALHELRAVRGVIHAIIKRPGDAVRDGETVVQIRIDGQPGRVAPPPKETPPERTRELPIDPNVPGRPAERRADAVNIPALQTGLVLVIGTEIKDGDNVPAEDVIVVKTNGGMRRFRALKAGDKVEDGQLIGLVDDRIARAALDVTKAQREVAAVKLGAAEKLHDEAAKRSRAVNADGVVPKVLILEAEANLVKTQQDVLVAKADLIVTEANLRQAEHVLSLYEIRAVRGEVTAVLKRRGEVAKEHETVVQIRAARGR